MWYWCVVLALLYLTPCLPQPETSIQWIPEICGSEKAEEFPDRACRTTTFEKLLPPDGQKFRARNTHASTVFKNEIWVTGGKSQYHPIYTLATRNTENDVWHSKDGAQWYEVDNLTGDFYAQNEDVKQPGVYAPWYSRYGHTLDALEPKHNGDVYKKVSVMVQLGGFAPQPMNDQWVSEDGVNWVYCGEAIWDPRAFHGTTTFDNKLWLMGGTPLNNEVWRLDSILKVPRIAPMTRAGYVNYTYSLTWTQMANAPWSPRVGFGIISHNFYDKTIGETEVNAYERLVFIGGFGGWVEPHEDFDGQTARDDIWVSKNGEDWTRIVEHAYFGPRAWFGLALWHSEGSRLRDVTISSGTELPRMWLFGGGNIGSTNKGPMKGKVLRSMYAHADAYWSRDGIHWTKINFEEGGGSTFVTFYSTETWTETVVDGRTEYLGMWGHTVEFFNSEIAGPGLFFLGGAYGGRGPFSQESYMNREGIFCDIMGETCSSNGDCGNATTGCECGLTDDGIQTAGEYCDTFAELEEETAAKKAICFAGSEIVLLESGASVFIQDVMVGDRILSANRYGRTSFSPVISIPHGHNNLKAAFHEITTASGYQVRMSPGHIVPAGPCDIDSDDADNTLVLLPLVTALQAEVGFCLYNLHGSLERITSNRRVFGEGIYSLVTQEEMIVVGGIVASPFAFSHYVPSSFYDLYRLGYRIVPQLFKWRPFISAHQFFSELIKEFFDTLTSGVIS